MFGSPVFRLEPWTNQALIQAEALGAVVVLLLAVSSGVVARRFAQTSVAWGDTGAASGRLEKTLGWHADRLWPDDSNNGN